jgi:uncharacterized protein YbcV (DUF1398 family)
MCTNIQSDTQTITTSNYHSVTVTYTKTYSSVFFASNCHAITQTNSKAYETDSQTNCLPDPSSDN